MSQKRKIRWKLLLVIAPFLIALNFIYGVYKFSQSEEFRRCSFIGFLWRAFIYSFRRPESLLLPFFSTQKGKKKEVKPKKARRLFKKAFKFLIRILRRPFVLFEFDDD